MSDLKQVRSSHQFDDIDLEEMKEDYRYESDVSGGEFIYGCTFSNELDIEDVKQLVLDFLVWDGSDEIGWEIVDKNNCYNVVFQEA